MQNIFSLANGGWIDDRDFTPCTVSCGGGLQTKTRHCTVIADQGQDFKCPCNSSDPNEGSCDGVTSVIRQLCNDIPCPSIFIKEIT